MTRFKNSQGFSAVEALLILVVVGILGFTGWFVYHSKQAADKSLTTTNSTVPTYKKRTSTNTKATTTLSKQNGYSFSYPSAWATTAHVDGLTDANRSSIAITSKDFASSNEGAGFHVTAGALMYVLVYNTTTTTSADYLKNMPHMQNVHSVTVAGQDATQYDTQWESSPSRVTVMVKDGKAYQVILDYANQSSLKVYQSDYDALVASFKLD